VAATESGEHSDVMPQHPDVWERLRATVAEARAERLGISAEPLRPHLRLLPGGLTKENDAHGR